jgi:serine/threonine protein kinase
MIPVSLLVVAVVVGFLVLVAVAVFLTLIKNNHSSSIKQGSSVSGNFVRELDKPITDVYKLSRTSLGEGASGKCYIATQIGSDRRYAVKTIDTRDENDKKYYERECQILKTVGEHYNVVRLFEVYRSPTSLHFVMELCLGGHLEEALERQPEHKFSESTVQRYVIQLLSAVAHCHRLGICHRDIKLQNILLESTMPGAPIKLIDFGNAKSFVNKVPMNQVVGTPYAMAPEVR